VKVVIFCGGMGLRLREHAEQIPKPMVTIGYRPILWHVMRYYAHYGHKEFILCLGYKADVIKDYFLSYNEALTNDFILEKGGGQITLLQSDIDDWRISFVDTGLNANIAQRLQAVEPFLGDDEVFLANYADVLTDAPLPEMVQQFESQRAVGQMMIVQPNYTFHIVDAGGDGRVRAINDVRNASMWINGGYFVLRREIFDSIRPGDELVNETFARLMQVDALTAYRPPGFWAPMDTLKDRQVLEELYQTGNRPWCVWEQGLPRADERHG
jgi:glucose-1-phosphate cytidylyltransferase